MIELKGEPMELLTSTQIARQFGVNPVTVLRRKRRIFKSKQYKAVQKFAGRKLRVLKAKGE